jgi:hypothetical protein
VRACASKRAGNAWEASRHHLIRADNINIAPMADVESADGLVGDPANVDTVMIDGRTRAAGSGRTARTPASDPR